MTKRHVFALILLAACTDPTEEPGQGGGGGKGDNPNAAFHDLTTSWEMTVGYGGDAYVRDVTELPGGSMFVTSTFPRWLIKATADGKRDNTFGKVYPGGGTTRGGSLALTVHELWTVDSSHTVATVGDGLLYELDSWLANGDPDPAFGTMGRVLLPYSDGKPLRVAYDKANGRFLAVVARAWETTQYFSKGPSKIEILAYDETTGAQTSAGVFDMPSWANDGTNPARIHELIVQPDGAFVLLASETIHTDDPSRASVASRWSTFRLATGQPIENTELAVTSYSAHVRGFQNLGAGHFDLYLDGTVDGISMAYNESKLVRISVDNMGVPQVDVLGPGLEFKGGCLATVATPDALVYGESVDRTKGINFTAIPKSGGAPITFSSDKPRRCLTSINVAPSGRIVAGTWDTTNTGWTAQLTAFE